jgi:hypothetical protein
MDEIFDSQLMKMILVTDNPDDIPTDSVDGDPPTREVFRPRLIQLFGQVVIRGRVENPTILRIVDDINSTGCLQVAEVLGQQLVAFASHINTGLCAGVRARKLGVREIAMGSHNRCRPRGSPITQST